MTAKIKLNAASGGGSVSIQAPSSSSNNRVISLPDIADGTLLTNQSSGLGKILQVVSTTNNAYAAQDSVANTKYGGLTVNVQITPSASTSKILLFYSVTLSAEVADREITLTPTVNDGSSTTEFALGLSQGSKVRINTSDIQSAGNQRSISINFHCLHEPNTTSQRTYGFRHTVQHDGAWIVRNQSFTSPDNANSTRSVTSVTAMEIGA